MDSILREKKSRDEQNSYFSKTVIDMLLTHIPTPRWSPPGLLKRSEWTNDIHQIRHQSIAKVVLFIQIFCGGIFFHPEGNDLHFEKCLFF